MDPKELFKYLRKAAFKQKSAQLEISAFLSYLNLALAETAATEELIPSKIFDSIKKLQNEGLCHLIETDGKPTGISFPYFFTDLVHDQYRQIDKNPEKPFPQPISMGVKIPPGLMETVHVRQEFIEYLSNTGGGDQVKILQLTFPNNINKMVVTSEYLDKKLLEYCVHKIRIYLNTQRNADYMRTRLQAIFSRRERLLRETLVAVQAHPGKAIQALQDPSDFSFQFWSHLASSIIKEYKEKKTKLPKEHSFCQAAYLIGFYIGYSKGINQKKKNEEGALRVIQQGIRKEPYYYTITDIYEFRDRDGSPVTGKVPREKINSYLEQKTNISNENDLPEILKLNSHHGKVYYISIEAVLPLCVKKIRDAARFIKAEVLNEWITLLDNFQKKSMMFQREPFLLDLEKRLKESDPLLTALLRYDLLFVLVRETKPGAAIASEVERLLNRTQKKLIPLDEILEINQNNLLADARMKIPLWKTIPVVSSVIRFITGIGKGAGQKKKKVKKERKKRSAPNTAILTEAAETEMSGSSKGGGKDTSSAEYNRAIRKLMTDVVGPSNNIEMSLDSLIEKWNPLLDQNAKDNLVEDVNSMVRDYLRRLKRSLKLNPPDMDRLANMAEHLSTNTAFEKIKRKEFFRHYIRIYMVKILRDFM